MITITEIEGAENDKVTTQNGVMSQCWRPENDISKNRIVL